MTLENIEDTSHYDILKSRIQASIETAQNLKQEIQAIETYIVTKHTEVGLMNMRMAVNRLATQLGM